MNNVLISIIVPIYNCEEYLWQCLSSISSQTLKEIEVICINDGSTDNSLNIIKSFSLFDNRFIVIDQDNHGVSYSRNIGLFRARSEYIMFVDSDDWLEPNACEILIQLLSKNQYDVVIFSSYLEYPQRTIKKNAFSDNIMDFDLIGCKDLYRRQFGLIDTELSKPEKQDYLSSVCMKIYKKTTIITNKISFTDLSIVGSYEDGLFNLHFFQYAKRALYIPNHLYHYRKGNSKSNTSTYKPNLWNQWKTLYSIMENHIIVNNLDDQYTIALSNRISLSIFGLGLNIVSSDKSIIIQKKEIKKILCDEIYKKSIKKMALKNLPIYWKFFYLFAKFGNAFLVLISLKLLNKMRGKV